jgi:hypothetical protein
MSILTRSFHPFGGAILAIQCITYALSQSCTFENEIDPYTMYNDLIGDRTAQSSDDCKAHCCKNPSCQVWQWSDDPMTPPNCWIGHSSDYGDSGGVEWQGEQGKGGPPPAPGPAPFKIMPAPCPTGFAYITTDEASVPSCPPPLARARPAPSPGRPVCSLWCCPS